MPRTVRAVIAICVAAVALAGAGWWLHTRRAAPPTATAASESSPPGAIRRDRPQRGDTGEPPRVVIDDDPRGTLRLEGQVIDAEDHGVAGATVVIASNPPRSMLTEGDGSFAFDGLLARPYALIARGAQGVAGPITTRLTAKSEPVVLRLRPAARLTVTVVGGDGKSITGATVELRGVDVQRAATRAGTAVFSPVVPGGYQIAAWADGMAHAFQRIQIGKGDSQARLVLAAGAPVTGRVVDDQGAGLPGARVRYSGASDWTQQASERHDAAITASDGSFRFDALPAGSFRFLASHPERAPGSSALITLDGRTPRDGVVIALEVGAVVRGRVVDPQQQPVAGAQVRIGGAAGPDGGRPGRRRGGAGGGLARTFEPPRQTVSDASGAFEIRGLPRKPLAAVALHETGASQTVEVDASAGDVDHVVLMLDVTGSISGTVVDPAGQPVEGAQVSALPARGGLGGPGGPAFEAPSQLRLRGIPEDVTDSSGRFALTGLAAGQYRLSAAPASRTGPRRGGFRDGVVASTGETSVRLVVQPDGSVKGKVAFADGSPPDVFTVSIQQNQQSFLGNGGAFQLDGIAPGAYQLAVRGPSFQSTSVAVTITAGATADAGAITVARGRSIAGIVVAGGQPVPDATVYAGRTVIGTGTTSAASGPLARQFGDATKTTTTDAGGAFSLSGFGDGELTVVAEQPAIGRSRAVALATVMPGQTELTLVLEPYGSLAGTVTQGGQPLGAIPVTCQSVATPGAIYTVVSGSDGAYRFDALAPDAYRVSAMVGSRRTTTTSYGSQVAVPTGAQVTLDIVVDPGTIAVQVTAIPSTGALGVASIYLVNGAITATSFTDLQHKLAGAGGTSGRSFTFGSGVATFTGTSPGAYSACVAPLPSEVRGGPGAICYAGDRSDALPVFCQPVTVAASPDSQSVAVPIVVPAYVPDPHCPIGPGTGGPGGGSGSGAGSGSSAGPRGNP